jgi:hypothetical protein
VKAVRLLLVVALAAMLTLFKVGTAGAVAPAPTCGTYPPSFGASMSVSTTTPFPGQTITVTGEHFKANEDFNLVLDTGAVLAAVHVAADGSFSVNVTLPAGLTGNHVISTDGDESGCPADPIQIDIQGSGTSGGGLASTGVDILTGLAIALALIAGGVLFARSGRRRHSHSQH